MALGGTSGFVEGAVFPGNLEIDEGSRSWGSHLEGGLGVEIEHGCRLRPICP